MSAHYPDLPATGSRPLEGLRLLDLSDGVIPFCGEVLGMLGAEVVLVERPGDERLRDDFRWVAYSAGKKSVCLDPGIEADRAVFAALAQNADVIVEAAWAPGEGSPFASVDVMGAVRLLATPFGSGGPRAGWKGSELIAQAAGGLLYLSGVPEFPPAMLGVPFGTCQAGIQAVVAILLALRLKRGGAPPPAIDLSLQEAVANSIFRAQTAAFVENRPDMRGAGGGGAATKKRRSLWPCADGWITWNLWMGPGWGRKNVPIVQWMNEQGAGLELADIPWEELSLDTIPRSDLESWERVFEGFFRERSKRELAEEALARRFTLTVFQDVQEILEDAQLRARNAFVPFTLPSGQSARIVGRPIVSSVCDLSLGGAAPALGEHSSVAATWAASPHANTATARRAAPPLLPLAGIRVLDFTWAIAGPATTKFLGMFGAGVVKVESRKRPDASRMTAPYPLGRASMNGSAMFANHSACKRSLALDIQHPEARELLLRLGAAADVVIENFTPGVLGRVRLTYDDFRQVNDDIVMVSMSLQGQTGPRATQPGLGNHIQAIAGIDELTGFPGGPPGGPNQVLPDFSGMSFGLVSVLSALEHRDRTGQGQCVDLSQYEALLMFVQPALLETQVTGKTPPRAGNRDPRFCPQGVYPVQGEDQWVALTVRSGAEWRALLGLLPAASRGALSGLDALAERNARADAIDAEIAAWSRAFDGSELAERLQAAGIAAYPVNTGPMLLADPQLAARGHYTWPEHPMIGKIPVDGPPFRLDALELDVRPGPMYGTHSFAVLNEWLGVEADEFANLMAAGVVLAE